MHMHAEKASGSHLEKLDNALNFLGELQTEEARYFKSAMGLDERIKGLKDKNKNYLIHEYFNREWHPFYHSDVVSDLSAARLSYISTADLVEHVDNVNLSAGQQAILDKTSDPVLRETVRDYIVNRQFRKDIFGRGTPSLSTHEAREEWLDTRFALAVRAQDVSMKVKALLGEVTIKADTCMPLIDAIEAAGGHARLRDLVREPAVARLGWDRLQRVLRLLVGSRAIHPCPAVVQDMDRRKKSATRFNKAVLSQAIHSDQLKVLASPVTGGGIITGRIVRLFLLAHLGKKENEVNFVWNILKGQGQKLTNDNKPLETEAENIAFLQERREHISQQALPLLQRLGVI